ncbi:MAG: tetratricopeptide repeat protein [Paludibacter sp.]|jgi:tetratricopeptide (TPR) repeat protein|nr:tetratricopeptide repeat protein [Paludibacter sp.]
MKKFIVLIISILSSISFVFAQQENSDVREGNRNYDRKKFTEAEILYRKGLEKNNKSFEGNFNLGNALFRQEKYADALEQFNKATALTPKDKLRAAAAYHNAGNALLMDNKIAESIENYKKALRLNPADNDTRYNLAFAQKLLQQQQQQQNKQNENPDDDDAFAKKIKELVAQRKYQEAYDMIIKYKKESQLPDMTKRILNVLKMNN